MVAKFEHCWESQYVSYAPCGTPTMYFNLNKDNTEGYVVNGDWYFDVLEFKPPYMKMRIQRGAVVLEFQNVQKLEKSCD
ncbi:TPA: hypothetical protein SIF59_004266 [Escherichia coli]|nr:hypothetical protein [Escherichia coli]